MIAKSLPAGSCKGSILYSGEKENGEFIVANDCFGTPKEIAKQFFHVQQKNTRTAEENKTIHSTIALPEQDKGKLTRTQEIQLIKDFAKALNLDKNQYVAYKHNDTKHPHYHFVANSINEEKNTSTNMFQNHKKHRDFCKEQEQKLGLTVAVKEKNIVTIGKKEIVTPDNSRIEDLKPIVQKNIKESKDIQDFMKRMEKDKIKTYLKGTGIAFFTKNKLKNKETNSVKINGSKLGRAFSLKGIEKQISNENKKDKIAIAFEVHQGKYAGKIPNISYNPTHLNKALKEKFGFELSKEEILKVYQLSKELNKDKNKGMKM